MPRRGNLGARIDGYEHDSFGLSLAWLDRAGMPLDVWASAGCPLLFPLRLVVCSWPWCAVGTGCWGWGSGWSGWLGLRGTAV